MDLENAASGNQENADRALQAVHDRSNEGWWPILQGIRSQREEAGHAFMDDEELHAYLAWLRGD
jgi:hypothetical protein